MTKRIPASGDLAVVHAVIEAARDGVARLRDRPRTGALVISAGAVTALISLLLEGHGLTGSLLQLFVLYPIFLAGSIGLLGADLGETRVIAGFLERVRTAASTVALAELAMGLVIGLGLLALFVLSMATRVDTAPFGAEDPATGWPANVFDVAPQIVHTSSYSVVESVLTGAEPINVVMIVGLSFGLALFQFADVAVVLDDASVTEALRTSAGLVVASPLRVLGYTLVRDAVTLATVLLPALVLIRPEATWFGPGIDAFGQTLPLVTVVTIVLFAPIGYLVALSYHVSFYQRLTARE